MRYLLDLYTHHFAQGWPPPNVITYLSLLFGSWAYALWRGGSPERIGSSILGVASLITLAMPPSGIYTYQTLELTIMAVDLACVAALLALALHADRYWPLWMAAFQILGTAGHVVRIVDADIIDRTYAFMIVIWSYPMVLLIFVGTWRHQKRLARFGFDRPWSSTATA